MPSCGYRWKGLLDVYNFCMKHLLFYPIFTRIKFKNKYLLKRNLPTPVGSAERNFFVSWPGWCQSFLLYGAKNMGSYFLKWCAKPLRQCAILKKNSQTFLGRSFLFSVVTLSLLYDTKNKVYLNPTFPDQPVSWGGCGDTNEGMNETISWTRFKFFAAWNAILY